MAPVKELQAARALLTARKLERVSADIHRYESQHGSKIIMATARAATNFLKGASDLKLSFHRTLRKAMKLIFGKNYTYGKNLCPILTQHIYRQRSPRFGRAHK